MIEHQLEWPPMTTRIVFILKRLGGARPLGLMNCLCRVQGRLRRGLLQAWQQSNYIYFWWAIRGKSAELSGLLQAAWTEYHIDM
eukprot:9024163-Pyramimonas_sp.AAC.1